MYMNGSRAWEYVTLLKGSNCILDNIDKLREQTKLRDWKYNPECAGGFYLIRDKNVAEFYAKEITVNMGTGVPTINQYVLNLAKIHENVREAYYNKLDTEALQYIGDNLSGKFPDNCKYAGDPTATPSHMCANCYNKSYKRSADFIEAILSNSDSYNLDQIILDLVNNNIQEEEALFRINNELKIAGSDIKIQTVLRDKAFDYLEYDHSYTI